MAYVLWDTDTGTGNNPATFASVTKGNVEAADLGHIAASEPTVGLANGRTWNDNTSATRIIPKLRQSAAWVSTMSHSATAHLCNLDLDLDGNDVLNLLLEKLATGSLSATEARLQWDTTLNVIAYGDGTNKLYVARTRLDGTSYHRIPCALNIANQGTPATASVATIFGGFLLDAAAERLNVVALQPIPNGWVGAGTVGDCILEIDCLLAAAETAGDDINIGCSWRSLSTGDLPSKTATAATDATYDISTNNAQYARHLVTLTIDHDHADNPLAVDDLFIATIDHDVTIATPVAGIIVVGAYLAVPMLNYDD